MNLYDIFSVTFNAAACFIGLYQLVALHGPCCPTDTRSAAMFVRSYTRILVHMSVIHNGLVSQRLRFIARRNYHTPFRNEWVVALTNISKWTWERNEGIWFRWRLKFGITLYRLLRSFTHVRSINLVCCHWQYFRFFVL
jgi:hypothetical protein